MDLVVRAGAGGCSTRAACRLLEVSQRRLERWRRRVADGGGLDDAAPGGSPVHGLTPDEQDEIVAVFNEWGDIDRSHRKLAHRGSWLGRFWADPSTVRRGARAPRPALPRPETAATLGSQAVAGLGRASPEPDLDLRHDALDSSWGGDDGDLRCGFPQVDRRRHFGR